LVDYTLSKACAIKWRWRAILLQPFEKNDIISIHGITKPSYDAIALKKRILSIQTGLVYMDTLDT
jgi:hypothetical protein